jgi:branched-chain amino acid transport system substrate-binding protein
MVIVALIGWRIYAAGRQGSGTVKIGAALALTGDAAPWGEVSRNAAELAVNDINQAGGINGKKLELVIEDMKSSSEGSVTAVSKLVNVDNVSAVMVTWLDSYPGAEAVMPPAMPLISQDAAIESVNVPVNHPNVFSLWYRTSSKAEVTLDAMQKDGVKTLYLVTQNDPYYEKLDQFLEAGAQQRGIQIVASESLNVSDDARTTVAKISAKKPDAVFFGSYDDGLSVAFIKRYREIVGDAVPLYGDEFIEQDFKSSKYNPAWFEGVKYYVPADPNPTFAAAYEKQFGSPPLYSADTTYDTVKVLAKYLADHPADVNQYMRKTTFSTITYGDITFDDIGGIVSDDKAITEKEILNGTITAE